ncbi:golgin subfamily A member 6-like protein 7 [Hyla sarda]|uniref:golgin subfamily A member 6-like protein 7 n=1 Tax=Hyla sarda TaxID=327740 RepID=UPI0024C44179|nr:golgin subfamily A member 6-like protein 7 [Hyla sarda]
MSSLHHPSCFCSRCPGNHPGAVAFVVGTLDGDPVKLNLLKDYVSDALYNLVHSFRASSFNVICFSEEISKWCDRSVTWTPETASQAISWIRTLGCDAGADPTKALAAAFEDPSCGAVYLVMDALPPRTLQDIYDFLSRDENPCSVNVVYLLEGPQDRRREGTFRTINLKPLRSSHKTMVNGYQRPSYYYPSSSSSSCTFSTVVSSEPQLEPIRCCGHQKEPPPLSASPVQLAPEALCLLRGARVLARRDTDGLYYMGHIAREVEGTSERFLVEFEKCRSLKGKSQFRMQETPVCDIIHYEDARWRPLVPGDHVLAPLDAKMEHYGPGTVLQGTENRARGLAFDSTGVLVTFWNGKTKQVPPGLAIWIPHSLSDRITLELYIPPESRKKLIESCTSFPFMDISDRNQEYQKEVKCNTPESHTCLYCGPNTGVCQKCRVPEELWVALRNSLNHINRITASEDKASKKVEKTPRNDVETGKEKHKPQKRSIRDQEDHQTSTHKEPLTRSRETQAEKFTKGEGDATVSSDKPSASSLGNMTHLQKTLQRIEKAMKEDRTAMESIILEWRPRSAPLKLNYEAKIRSNQELREQKEAAAVELQRMRLEERQMRKEEKNWELDQRELMLQDNRRLRSQQRILFDLERKQDQEGLGVQQAESRRAATEKRSRKKDDDLRKEWRKEDQKLQFWSDLRQQRENLDLEKIQRQQEKEEKHKEQVYNQMITQQRQQEADLQERRTHQQLQERSKQRVSRRLEEFYQQAEQESQKDKDLQQYLKEHNLQALRSAMVL